MHRVELKVLVEELKDGLGLSFLMHRVELKAINVAGSERKYLQFLMHRVELKVTGPRVVSYCPVEFLMHRVELKEQKGFGLLLRQLEVPNAPCGVERTLGVSMLGEATGS